MTEKEFVELADKGIVVLDGGTGSMLQAAGMPAGVCPEQWILEHREIMLDIQRQYIEAGSNIIYAPTFGGNRVKLSEYGLEGDIERINKELVAISREAVAGKEGCYVAGDITMTGEQLYPIGTRTFEELVEIYKEQLSYLYEAGIDLVVVETMMSLQECRAALLAVKETSDLPVMVSLSFNEDGRTLYGTDPKTAVVVLQSMGAAAVGANCSSGATQMLNIIKMMSEVATIPIIAKPNFGIPALENGKTVYNSTYEEYETGVAKLFDAGATILGGCCGTDPECIRRVKKLADSVNSNELSEKLKSLRGIASQKRILSSERSSVDISDGRKLYIIGERINPTGKKDLQAELREGNLDMVVTFAEEQEEYGADILDINVGMNGIDEKETIYNAVMTVSSAVNLPLSIDTSNVDAMEYAIRNYPGRALMNSISLDLNKMDRLLSIAKKYGAMFVLLPLSEEGLPKDLDEKKNIIDTIVAAADKYNIPRKDIVVDGLVTTVGANKNAALETLETIRYCSNELGVSTVCGLSNISFGLPERSFVNSAFIALAINAGLTMAIANPMQELLMNTVYSTDLLMAREDADVRYVERVTIFNEEHKSVVKRNTDQQLKQDSVDTKSATNENNVVNQDLTDPVIYEAVLKGRKDQIVNDVKAALNHLTPEEIINGALVPAINKVGELFEKGRYFLPQLMKSAEAMKTAVDYLEPLLEQSGEISQKNGVVVIATVKGDIHDIGKNLVAIMLKNCGFEIHDLGKNVEAEDIIAAATEYDADIIGLSALMTTTMMEMKKVVELARTKNIKAKIMIGGAVVTDDFANEIGADAYSKDAGEAVKVATTLVNGGTMNG